jgi:ferrous iron transport protein A
MVQGGSNGAPALFAGAAPIQVIIVRNYDFASGWIMTAAFNTNGGINAMQRGEIAVIVAVDRDGRDPTSARRLHEMGFDTGVDIELLHRAPLGGDPLAVRVGNMTVALRQALAALVEIAPLPDTHAA